MDESRRTLLKATAALLVDQWAAARLGALAAEPSAGAGRKVVVLTCGGIRREDSLRFRVPQHSPSQPGPASAERLLPHCAKRRRHLPLQHRLLRR